MTTILSEKGHRGLNAEATSHGPRAPQVLSYECFHVTDAATGVRIGWVPAGARVKDILTVCPECANEAPRPKRTKAYDWSDTGQHSI
ncbi:MAG: hypothetical protein MUP14_07905 [Dehalococcoidia bacterium]|nr:hypothetical protein [Dehalococcoidia bacterium]